MLRTIRTFLLVLPVTAILFWTGLTSAQVEDIDQFRGPNRAGLCSETGLLQEWPEGGPELLWQIEGLGDGYSSVSIVDGRLITMGDLDHDGEEKQYVMAYDLQTREELWSTLVGPEHRDGPRCTPTVDGDLTYVVGTSGDLLCVKTETGEPVWSKNFGEDFNGRMMSGWRYSESPLVDGDKLLVTPGGPDAMMAALDKKTGETLWTCAADDNGAGYSSIVVSEACGVRQYVQVYGHGIFSAAADDGRLLWKYDRVSNGTANITNPIVRDDYVFVTTSYRTGSALLHLNSNGDGIAVTEVWFVDHNVFENHHGGVVLLGDYIYGGDGQNRGTPVCLELMTGEIAWKADPPGRGSAAVLYADGQIIFRYDSGETFLIEATPDAFKINGRFEPPTDRGKAWAHPVIHDGKLYLRHGNILCCFDVKE